MRFSCPRSLSNNPRTRICEGVSRSKRSEGGCGGGRRLKDVGSDGCRRHVRRQDVFQCCASSSTTNQEDQTYNQSTTAIGSDMWDLFTEKTAGEWRGILALYDKDGRAIALPENYVDDAYKEWDVRLFDWQTQCSMKVDENGLDYKLRRLFMASGCEADSVAMTDTVQALKSSEERKSEDKTVTTSGDYSIGPRCLPQGENGEMTVEACFGRRKMDHRLRVRVHLKNHASGDLYGWRIEEVEVHKEIYQGEYVGGLDVEDFNKPVTKIEKPETYYHGALDNFWLIDSRFTYGVAEDGSLYLKEKFAGLPRELLGWDVQSDQFVPLPEGLWCCLDVSADPIGEVAWLTKEELESSEDEEAAILSIQVGWLVHEKRVLVCSREYHESGGLVTVDMAGCNFFQELV
ncbi:hypothetical protein BSKO_14048 [Bryopsis sp. KO-2023]|nr:hypothetical protein BSKO_14048 [Bryopsis sp. KO-2023]